MRKFFISALLCFLTIPFIGLKATDIYVNEMLIPDGEVYTVPFCLNEQPIEFSIPTFVYGECTDSVVWDFGDGTSAISVYSASGEIKVEHTYTTQNWYTIRAHCFCSADGTDEWTSCSIRVVGEQDTVVTILHRNCFTRDFYEANTEYCDRLLAFGEDSIGEHECYEPVPLFHFEYCLEDIVCIQLELPTDAGTQCPGEDLEVSYTKYAGKIEEAAFVMGNQKEPVTISNDNTTGTLTLPTHSIAKAGHYQGELVLTDHWCEETFSIPVHFTVLYPDSIFRFKFNNVLAVYQPGYGGNIGYDFVAYQWYLNNKAIEGATESIYCSPEPFKQNDEVYVVLTDRNGMTLPSCPQVLTDIPSFAPTSNQAPAQKMLYKQQLVIRVGDATYDIYGQRIE